MMESVKTGSEQKSDLDNIYTDNDRTAKNRIESLEASYIISSGESDCCTLTSGHRFHLKNHPNSDYNLPYILLSITHDADQSPAYSSNNIVAQAYRNYFTCIPHGSGKPEFRPELKTPKPIVRGSQTAIVVGPPNEEIFTWVVTRKRIVEQTGRPSPVKRSTVPSNLSTRTPERVVILSQDRDDLFWIGRFGEGREAT